ncbi:MAG: hypothetical protein P4M00_06825 [Azospirillaceae bacterium]|nr:hypothetical protein [Azospirillaceae bacterium]
MADKSAFELSRIYAKGWSAGKGHPVDLPPETLEATVAALNPYEASDERERWTLGFRDALRRNEEMASRGSRHKRVPVPTPIPPSGE